MRSGKAGLYTRVRLEWSSETSRCFPGFGFVPNFAQLHTLDIRMTARRAYGFTLSN